MGKAASVNHYFLAAKSQSSRWSLCLLHICLLALVGIVFAQLLLLKYQDRLLVTARAAGIGLGIVFAWLFVAEQHSHKKNLA